MKQTRYSTILLIVIITFANAAFLSGCDFNMPEFSLPDYSQIGNNVDNSSGLPIQKPISELPETIINFQVECYPEKIDRDVRSFPRQLPNPYRKLPNYIVPCC